MEPNDVKEITELITNVRLDLKGLDTKMDGIKDLARKVEEIQLIANKALLSSEAGHKRSDDHKTRIDDIQKHYDNEIRAVNTRIESEIRVVTTKASADNKELTKLVDDEVEKLIVNQSAIAKENKVDRRWLIATIITVVIAIVSNAMKFI